MTLCQENTIIIMECITIIITLMEGLVNGEGLFGLIGADIDQIQELVIIT
jgi:hypothetical protein